MEAIKTLLVAAVPAIISGLISFVLAKSQAKAEVKKLQLANEHEIERLMEQHKVDIDSIREQHRLEMESKEKDHHTNVHNKRICKDGPVFLSTEVEI